MGATIPVALSPVLLVSILSTAAHDGLSLAAKEKQDAPPDALQADLSLEVRPRSLTREHAGFPAASGGWFRQVLACQDMREWRMYVDDGRTAPLAAAVVACDSIENAAAVPQILIRFRSLRRARAYCHLAHLRRLANGGQSADIRQSKVKAPRPNGLGAYLSSWVAVALNN